MMNQAAWHRSYSTLGARFQFRGNLATTNPAPSLPDLPCWTEIPFSVPFAKGILSQVSLMAALVKMEETIHQTPDPTCPVPLNRTAPIRYNKSRGITA